MLHVATVCCNARMVQLTLYIYIVEFNVSMSSQLCLFRKLVFDFCTTIPKNNHAYIFMLPEAPSQLDLVGRRRPPGAFRNRLAPWWTCPASIHPGLRVSHGLVRKGPLALGVRQVPGCARAKCRAHNENRAESRLRIRLYTRSYLGYLGEGPKARRLMAS